MIIGIDPGFTGAVSFVDGQDVDVFDIPVFEVVSGKKKKKYVDIAELHTMLASFSPEMVVIEKVHAMPGQGVTSMFRFGECYGILQAVVTCCGYPKTFVTPRTWKKHFGLNSDKGASRRLASDLYPDHSDKWARVKDDGRAESVLIARWYEFNRK
jgi:crossover junction endodeoxyribonuclease RuvC